MRKSIIRYLQCPACKSVNLDLDIHTENSREVIAGLVHCGNCQRTYPINRGVLEIFDQLDELTLRERNARNVARDWSIERQRPFINDKPEMPWVWPSFTANVLQGLHAVNLAGKRALDIGAATCWSTRMMCELGAEAFALDISTSMLHDGEAQFSEKMFFDRFAASMDTLPFSEEVFDITFFSATLHHTNRLEKTIREVARCLKRGGVLILVNEPVLGYLRRAGGFGEYIENGINEHIYRYHEYLHAVRGAGLTKRVFFPQSLTDQLSGKIPSPETNNIRIFRKIWQRTPKEFWELTLPLLHTMFGLDLVLFGYK